MDEDDTLVIPEPDSDESEYIPASFDDFLPFDSRRVAPTAVECAVVHPAFKKAELVAWTMPEELKRTWHFCHAMPEFWQPKAFLFGEGTSENPFVL